MADENIDLRFIGEQLLRLIDEVEATRNELSAMHAGSRLQNREAHLGKR
jgi:hypothetical protein